MIDYFAIKHLMKAIVRSRDKNASERLSQSSCSGLMQRVTSRARIYALSSQVHAGSGQLLGGPSGSLPCSLLLMSGLCLGLSTRAEELIKTYILNTIPIKHIPGITGKREERAFKKFILSLGHLEASPTPANFRWNFDQILSECFSSFWERTFLSVQLQPPVSPWHLFENSGVCCHGNQSQVRLTGEPPQSHQEHVVSFCLV